MGNEIKNSNDVVEEKENFNVSPKIQNKMQTRHNLMLNIQNISKIINDHEIAINRYAAILESMSKAKEKPHYRIMGDFMIPITDGADAVDEIELHVQKLAGDLDKHINQVKSMQAQHDSLSKEIDLMMEIEKGAFKPIDEKRKHKARRN